MHKLHVEVEEVEKGRRYRGEYLRDGDRTVKFQYTFNGDPERLAAVYHEGEWSEKEGMELRHGIELKVLDGDTWTRIKLEEQLIRDLSFVYAFVRDHGLKRAACDADCPDINEIPQIYRVGNQRFRAEERFPPIFF